MRIVSIPFFTRLSSKTSTKCVGFVSCGIIYKGVFVVFVLIVYFV